MHTARPALYGGRQPRDMLRPSQFKHTYGVFFNTSQKGLPQILIDFCQDTCRAVEIFENQNIVFDPVEAKRTGSNDTHYFYFVRSRLANEFIHLNAGFADSFDKAKCILLATKIVDYLVLVDNYISTIPMFLATRIKECLERQIIVEEWSGTEDALIWVIWVAACVPQIDKNIKRVLMNFLTNQAETVYWRTQFSSDWNKQGVHYQFARRFVWASALDDKLGLVCDEEDGLLRRREIGVD